jgi:CRISPR-associated RAMP protein (TIGR02581 family)
MIGFDTLQNRYVLRARLKSEGALHIGTGVAGVTTDAPFIRIGNAPYIPGSSLRGSLRSTVERIVHAVMPAGKFCFTFEARAAECDSSDDAKNDLSGNTKKLDASKKQPNFCALCHFFGSTSIASRFKISDAVQTFATTKEPVRRDGVGIDRDTETAKEQIKYDFEVLEPGGDFELTMQLENIGDQDRAILYMLLVEMQNGFDVGGKRSRGLGRMTLYADYDVSYFRQGGDYQLVDYLRDRKLKTVPTAGFERELRAAFIQFTKPNGGAHA